MSAETEALRQDIDGIRDSMTETLEYLETRLRSTMDSTLEQVRQSLDLERQVRERPWVALGMAALAGYMLGSMDEEPRAPYAAGPSDNSPPMAGNELGGELNTIAAAAASTVGSLLRQSLGASLPHFDEEYERARRERGS